MSALKLTWIPPDAPLEAFPNVAGALRDPDGLLVAGADLSPERLLHAYRHGIFPWYSEGQPILWWSPDPRTILFPDKLHISHSLRKCLRREGFEANFDAAFNETVAACAARRAQYPDGGTWITPAMQAAYGELHRLGYAHSLEIRMHGELVGGLYGVALGGVFFGESMFSRRANASKIALACLAKQLSAWGFGLIDCQVHSGHLARLGSISIPRAEFLALLERYAILPNRAGPWQFYVPLEF